MAFTAHGRGKQHAAGDPDVDPMACQVAGAFGQGGEFGDEDSCFDDVELVEAGDYPTAVGDALGQDLVYVGRLRAGLLDPCELNLWIASDNVRKGSALNAVQLGELLLNAYL